MLQVVRDGSEIAGQLSVTDPEQAYSFWKTELPPAGYTVRSAEMVGGAGEIRFTGHGCVGNSQIAFTGTQVAVQCDLA